MKVWQLKEVLDKCMDNSDIGIVLGDGSIVDFMVDRFEHQIGSFLLFPVYKLELEEKIINQIQTEFERV